MVAVTARRRLALVSIGVGMALAAAARLLAPGAPPLYDGVVINEPYRWLEPPPGELGGAQGVSATAPLEDGASPLVALATSEQPPQAQVFAPPGALTLPPGTRSLAMSITPIAPSGAPSGHIAGNVYRFVIANQDGVPATAPADAFVSIVMRGPDDVFEATIERFTDGAWQSLDTSHAGYTNGFLAIVTEFGDFALVAEGASPTAEPQPTASAPPPDVGPLGGIPLRFLVAGVAAAALVLAAAALWLYRSTRAQRPPPKRRRRRKR
jgi:hypothetical protein